MTESEYLEWESKQPVKYEFDGQYPVSWGYDTIVPEAMVGVSAFHAAIQANLILALGNKLADSACRPYGSELKVKVGTRYRYPDAMVLCRPPRLNEFVVDDPAAVFEILSETSWHRDMFVKSRDYLAIETVQHYVVLSQRAVTAYMFTKPQWRPEQIDGPEAMLDLTALNISMPLGMLYADLDFSGEAEEAG